MAKEGPISPAVDAPRVGPGEVRMLVDGKLTEARSGAQFDNINPATEEVLGPVADASVEEMRQAIEAARRAFDASDWSTNAGLRRRCLEQLQAALESEREELRRELVAEVGSPLSLTYKAMLDVPLADALPWACEMIDRYPQQRDLEGANSFGVPSRRQVWKVPVGVVGAITPWNVPLEIILNKLGPALAMGNTVVLKPAPDTPWNATRVGRLVAEHTDVPPGVVNVIPSSDHAVGEELVLDPRVDMISFTGSTATGKRIMAIGASTLKRLFLELGGKSAHIFLDDADLPATLPAAAGAVCGHAGQGCSKPTRVLLPRSRYDEGIQILEAATRAVPYGDPTDPAVIQGPQISAVQRQRVLDYIAKGVEEGARLVVGGGRPPHLPTGFFVEPTLFADVENSMTIAQEEIFGPVIVVIPFVDDDDAVRVANDSVYGLGGEIRSASEERALAVARRLRTGTIGVNGGVWYGPDAPFGGFKSSGVGRQNGTEGLEQYLETTTVGLPPPGGVGGAIEPNADR